jgi:hypothetical protein
MTLLSYTRVKFAESLWEMRDRSSLCDAFSHNDRELTERIRHLENEKHRLEALVCELLHKNQKLRRESWQIPLAG